MRREIIMSMSWAFFLSAIAVVPLLATIGFCVWIRRRRELSFDDKTKAWQVFISLITAFTAVIGGVVVIGKYVDEQARQAQRDRLHIQIQALSEKKDRKAQLYGNAERVANKLVKLDPQDFDSLNKGLDRAEFEQLYWGQLIGVESRDVESAMVHLRRALQRWSEEKIKPPELEQLVLSLSHACAKDLADIEKRVADLNDRLSQVGAEVLALFPGAASPVTPEQAPQDPGGPKPSPAPPGI
jgi:hypothetical protein